ncbi:MAG: hypothetical protein AAFW81_03070 [Pseudomonadota bacterium]
MTVLDFSLRAALAAFVFAGVWSQAEVAAHPRGHASTEPHRESVATDATDADELVQWRTVHVNDPTDEAKAVAFARRAAKQARRLGDTGLLREAEKALAAWRDDPAPPTEILIIRANTKQIDHQFYAALDDLAIVLNRQPAHPQALLSRAFVLATTGNAAAGGNDCAALRPTVSVAIRETCSARLSSLTGALNDAHRRIEAILTITPATRREERSFALSVAGEIADRRGDVDIARKHYSELLAADPMSVFARAVYANFLLSQGEHARAIHVIGDKPQTEALLVLSALAGLAQDNPTSRDAAEQLRARMTADQAAGDFSHAREYARFAIDYEQNSTLALNFAQMNWRDQKEPVDARLLARAAIAEDADLILSDLMEWRRQTGLEDPTLDRILEAATADHAALSTSGGVLTQP